MNFLIIGGTGVLSSAVTLEAQKNGISVTMINRGRRPVPDGVELIKADKDNIELIQKSLFGRHFDAVADFLCYTPEQSRKSYTLYSQYSDQYFYISSMAVYDKTVSGPLTEDHAKGMKLWKYSTDKWASEQLINELALGKSCKITVIRPGVTYGNTRIPFDIYPAYGYHWTFAARALANKPIILCDCGEHIVKPLRVEDFAVGFVGLIGNPKAFGEAFNICATSRHTYIEIIEILGKLIGKKIPVIDIPKEWYAQQISSRAGELLVGRCMEAKCSPEEELKTNQKIKSVVPDFCETLSLKEGLEMTIDTYRQQNYLNGIDWTFDADTDRIIKKWCKEQSIDYRQFNLGFVNYLSTATLQDRFTYWQVYNKENLFVRSIIFGTRIMQNVIHRIKPF